MTNHIKFSQLQWADTWDTDVPLPLCADLDEDCAEVPCKVTCWLYDPERGICPYLLQRETKS